MSTLQFVRSAKLLIAHREGHPTAFFPAANNVDSHSRGPWPDGVFAVSHYDPHEGDAPSSAYGALGILVFDVPGREGMGVHAGREGVPDGLGREGYLHCTMGCIRTTQAAMQSLLDLHAADPIISIDVREA